MIKTSGLKYKTIERVEWFLGELYGYDSSDIEGDDFDVVTETECGNDSSFSVSIVDLAGDARGVINQQQEEIKALKAHIELGLELDKTPQQCLADHDISLITSIIGDIEVGMAHTFLDGDDVLDYLKAELDKLKGG